MSTPIHLKCDDAHHAQILQLGLHIQVGRQLDEVGRDVKEGLRLDSFRGSEVR